MLSSCLLSAFSTWTLRVPAARAASPGQQQRGGSRTASTEGPEGTHGPCTRQPLTWVVEAQVVPEGQAGGLGQGPVLLRDQGSHVATGQGLRAHVHHHVVPWGVPASACRPPPAPPLPPSSPPPPHASAPPPAGTLSRLCGVVCRGAPGRLARGVGLACPEAPAPRGEAAGRVLKGAALGGPAGPGPHSHVVQRHGAVVPVPEALEQQLGGSGGSAGWGLALPTTAGHRASPDTWRWSPAGGGGWPGPHASGCRGCQTATTGAFLSPLLASSPGAESLGGGGVWRGQEPDSCFSPPLKPRGSRRQNSGPPRGPPLWPRPARGLTGLGPVEVVPEGEALLSGRGCLGPGEQVGTGALGWGFRGV